MRRWIPGRFLLQAACLLPLGAAGCVAHTVPASGLGHGSGLPAVAEPVPGAPTSDPRETGVLQTLTVVNPTSLTIEIDLVSEREGRAPISASFGPIAPAGRGSGTIPVDRGGTLRVTARWTDGGAPQVGRPYTVTYEEAPITPATMTFDSPYEGLGIWTSILWDPP